jgi:uncharacterized membrane protein
MARWAALLKLLKRTNMANTIKTDKRFFYKLDANYRLMIAVIVGIIVYFCCDRSLTVPELALASWIGCALTIIILNWIIILTSHPMEVKKIAKLQDSSRRMLFIFIITASMVSLVAIIFLLKSVKGVSEAAKNEHIALAISAVAVSWWLVHTVFTLKYAHMYYDTSTDDGKPLKVGGLDFPANLKDPDYLDFVYFAFVVGMTFQVSDVVITDRQIRHACLIHGIISFVFNTTIVALSINVISGLVSQ